MTIIDVLLFDGCEALDALGPLEVLRYGGLDVEGVSLDDTRMVRTSQGLEVMAQPPRDDAEWLVMPGGRLGGPAHPRRVGRRQRAVGKFARRHRARGGMLAGVCTGTMWLAEAGLIGSRPATTHHQFWDELAALGADVRRGERVVDDATW